LRRNLRGNEKLLTIYENNKKLSKTGRNEAAQIFMIIKNAFPGKSSMMVFAWPSNVFPKG